MVLILQNNSRQQLPNPSWVGVIIGTVLCCIAIGFQVEFRLALVALPANAAIRPMGLAVIIFGLALGGLLLGVPFSILGIMLARTERKRVSLWLGWIGLILSLMPLPISKILSDQTLRATGVQLSP